MDRVSSSAYVRVSEPQLIATFEGAASALWVINAGTTAGVASDGIKTPATNVSAEEFVLGSNIFFTIATTAIDEQQFFFF